jgi:hypothetical protein
MSIGLTTLVVFGLSMSACAQKERMQSEAREEFREVTGQTQVDWNERKESFVSQSETRLTDLSQDVRSLQSAAKKVSASQRKQATSELKRTEEMINKAKENLNDLRQATAVDWDSKRNSFQNYLNQVEEKYSDTKRYYN